MSSPHGRKPGQWSQYLPQAIEPKWQSLWEQGGLYLASEKADRPKYYCLDFFPYPSGDGLHVGHARNYVPTDVISRFKRMQGYNVLHPMGWDSFGEPTEQYAISTGVQPRVSTDNNTRNFKRQFRIIGTSYDWSREIDSSRPEFYRWTQWFFTRLYRRGLAYRATNWQWWCPVCQTTLSNNEAAGGVCWRGHTGLSRREIPAWYFRITAYADELLAGLDDIDWPEPIKTMQRHWIGRSQGCEITFRTLEGDPVGVFTTRPDTLYGVTFFVLAPEHELARLLTSDDRRDQVEAYIEQASRQTEIERQSESRPKTGVFTGGYVLNPINAARVPVFIADYVLPSYGTGAVMGVPAHDPRDFEFAAQHQLPVKSVIVDPDTSQAELVQAYTGSGRMVNSGPFDGLSNLEGAQAITEYLEQHELGGRAVQYRMHDWLISRQRYWGTPIPIVYCDNCGAQPLPDDQLPLLLPAMEDFAPDGTGRAPLARLPEFVRTSCPVCDGPARRETDTMGGFACSSWYFLRFTSPDTHTAPFDPQAMRYWMPVDLYVGGAEHAVLHLLYARFWTMFLADEGQLPFREPFSSLRNQGQLLGPDGQRMSKSRGNVVTPDEMVATFGADALRVYEMFMAPFEQDVSWSAKGINGSRRFLNRIWKLYGITHQASRHASGEDASLRRLTHQTVLRVSERIETFRLNTMISALMEFVNALTDRLRQERWRTADYHQALETLLLLLAPSVPHLAEELWALTGHSGSVHSQPWPVWDPELAWEEQIEIAVQVDSRVRAVVDVPAQAGQDEVLEKALANPKVSQHLAGRRVAQIFFVPGRIINLVTASAEANP
jgi:leucyl-tRNA synthetase